MASKPLWFVRAGRGARYLSFFEDEALVAIGWAELEDYPLTVPKTELQAICRRVHPTWSAGKVAIGVGQILRFLQEMEVGDTVVTYDPSQRRYLLGEIQTLPERMPESGDLSWRRKVEWSSHVGRDRLSATTRHSLGAISTLFKPSPEAAAELLEKCQPLTAEISGPVVEESPEEDDETSQLLAEVVAKAEEFIEDRLAGLGWEEMQELVAGILRAMGYRAEVAERGPDRGVDIFASPDGLGLEEPRIFVEVKHRQGSTGGPSVRSFLGGRQPGDRCLFVSTGGFTKDARYEADRANVAIRLVTLPRLRELVVEHYDDLEPEVQNLVPLRRILWPVES